MQKIEKNGKGKDKQVGAVKSGKEKTVMKSFCRKNKILQSQMQVVGASMGGTAVG